MGNSVPALAVVLLNLGVHPVPTTMPRLAVCPHKDVVDMFTRHYVPSFVFACGKNNPKLVLHETDVSN